MTTLNMLQLGAKFGEISFSPLVCFMGHFQQIGISALLFELKPLHVQFFENTG